MDSIKLVEGLTALLGLFFIYHLWAKKKGRTSFQPPEPGGAWPVVGHLGLLKVGTAPLHRTLAAISEKHGPLFTLRLGQMRALVVNNTDLAKECFTTHDKSFCSRPPLQNSKHLGYDHAMFGFTSYGAYWRQTRNITTMELLSNRQLELLKDIRVEEVNSLIWGLYRSCGGNRPVNMNQCLGSLSMNIISRMVAGKRYFNLDGEADGGEADEFRKAISEFQHLMGTLTAADAVPWLEWLDVDGHIKAMKKIHRKLDGIVSAWLAEHRQEKESGRMGRDFIDVLIEKVDGRLSERHQTHTIIKATVMMLMAAATDTTSLTLEWTLAALLNNRRTLQKAQEELDTYVGRERRVEESDMKNLPYLQAIVKESMRLYPVTPLFVPHQSIEPVRLGGYHIPAGTVLFVNAWKIFRDPMVWVDPQDFKPERFLEGDGRVGFAGQSFAFMPFGSGRRMCPGWTMALQVIYLTLASLLHGFEWSTPVDEPVDMTEGFGLSMPKASPLRALVSPRLPPHLYR
ncbi:unnamed protein product [Victoria cruziana]